MDKIKVFIIMFNHLTWPKRMAEFLSDTGCEVIFLDNCSTYPPLIEWYNICPYKVYRFDKNHGPLVLWNTKLLENYQDRYYVVTDHDLGLDRIPPDYIDLLFKGLRDDLKIMKSGFSFELEDLPSNDFIETVKKHETKFWESPQNSLGFYKCPIDTTFAVYDRERHVEKWIKDFSPNPVPFDNFYSAVRSPRPYTARHLPWYLTPENLTEEDRYYFNSCQQSYWLLHFKHDLKIQKF